MSKQNPKEQSAYNSEFGGLMSAGPLKRWKEWNGTGAN